MDGFLAVCLLMSLSSHGAVPADDDTVAIHRCIDSKGGLSLQDSPCPPGTQQSVVQMQRPKDPPPDAKSAATELAPPTAAPLTSPSVESHRPPPPPLYRCTSYDGIARDSEHYDPNPRCEPLALYFPNPNLLTPELAGACRWVEDSCVRLSDEAACARWKQKKEEAASAALHAFSDTAAYRNSELERATQIVDESCR